MADSRKFSIDVEVNASRATQGLTAIDAQARRVAHTIASMSAELKKLYTERSGGRTAADNFLPDPSKVTKQAQAIKAATAAVTELGKAGRALDGIDIDATANKAAEAFTKMADAMAKTSAQGLAPEMVSNLREQVKLLKEAQALSASVASSAQQVKTPKAQTVSPAVSASSVSANSADAAAAASAAQANRDLVATLSAQAVEARKAASSALIHTEALESVRFGAMQLRNTFALLTAASAAAAAAVISNAADQERAFVDVARTMETTPKALEGLRQEYQKLSTEISTPFEDLSRIGTLGAQMNIAKEDLGDFTKAVAGFASATGESIDSTTESFGRLVSFFNQAKSIRPDFQIIGQDTGDQYERLASQVAELGAKAVATEGEILKMSESIVTTTAAAGIGQNDTLAYATALTSVGIKAEHARGSLQRVFAGFNKNAADGAKGLQVYANQMHITAEEAENLWRTDPSKFFQELLKSLRAAKDGIEQTQMLGDLGLKNTRDIELVKRLANNYGVLEQAIRNSNEASKDSSYLQQSLDLVNSTLTETIKRWKNSLSNFMSNFGEPFLAPLKAILNLATGIQNALASWGDTGVGRAVAGIAGGLATFVALKGVIAAVKVAALGLASSYSQVQVGLVKAGTSGELTWRNIITLTRQASAEVQGYAAKVAAASAAEAKLAAAKSGATASSTTSAAASGVSAAKEASTKLATANAAVAASSATAAAGMRSVAASTATATASAGVATTAMSGLRTALTAVGLASPWGWIGLGLTLIPSLVAAFGDFGDKAESASKKAEESAHAAMESLGGAKTIWNAVMKDQEEINSGQQQSLGNLTVPVDAYGSAVEDASKKMYWFINASGQLTQATKEEAEAHGYATIQVGKHLQELQLQAITSSDAFKNMSTELKASIANSNFDFGGWIKAGQQGSDSANQFIDSYVNQLRQRLNEISEVQKTTRWSSAANANVDTTKTTYTDPQLAAELQAQIKAAQELKNVDLPGVMSQTASEMSLTQQAAQALGVSQEDLAGSTDDASSSAKDAAQAWNDYVSAMTGVVDAAFSAVNAQASLYSSTDALTDAIAKNGNTFDVATEAGRDNVEALQAYIKSVVEYSAQAAQALGYTGAEAQRYVQEQVSAAIAELNNQGIDTSAVDDTLNYVSSALGQTIPGMQVDFSVMDMQMNAAVQKAQATANAIRAIMGSVGGMTTGGRVSMGGSTGAIGGAVGGFGIRKAGGFGALGGGVAGVGFALGRNSSAGRKTGASRAALDLGAILRNSMAGAPSRVASPGRSSGGGGGGRSPRSSGGGSRSSRKEKTAEEIFADFLSRLNTALKNAVDKFWKMSDAQDGYHTALRNMQKRVTEAREKIEDLRDSLKDLNQTLAEQQQKLHDAEYFNSIAVKYGDKERIKSTQTEVDSARNDVQKTQKDIGKKNQELIDTSANITALNGYTEAAMANRAALKSVQEAAVELINAYAASGATTQQLAAYTQSLKNDFIEQAVQAGFNRGEVTNLAGAFDGLTASIWQVPRRVDEEVTDNGTIAATQAGIDSISGGSVPVSVVPDGLGNFKEQVKWAALSGLGAAMGAAVGLALGYQNARARYAGGLVGFASGGLVPGKPPVNRNVDNLRALTQHGSLYGIRSGEYVMSQSAVDYYGSGMMEAINSRRIPVNAGGGSADPGFVTINPMQIQELARAVSNIIELDGRAISENSNKQWSIQGGRGRY